MDEIACTLNADDFNRRRVELLPGLIARSAACEELPDGLRWRFAPEDGLLLLELLLSQRAVHLAQQEPAVADDRGERRPELVAHQRE